MIILTRDQMIELLQEAVAIIEKAGFGFSGSHHSYGIPAFEIVVKQLFKDGGEEVKTGDEVE